MDKKNKQLFNCFNNMVGVKGFEPLEPHLLKASANNELISLLWVKIKNKQKNKQLFNCFNNMVGVKRFELLEPHLLKASANNKFIYYC